MNTVNIDINIILSREKNQFNIRESYRPIQFIVNDITGESLEMVLILDW